MTNCNGRLEEVLNDFGWTCIANGGDGYGLQNEDVSEAKQAITSLMKEMVAEAKPDDYISDRHEPGACAIHLEYHSQCLACRRQKARVEAINEFEQNILKSLEEA